MPENFCLESNYDECIERLRKLRLSLNQSARQMRRYSGAGQNKRARVASFLDFSTIKRCTPATALVLAAEYDRARSLLPSGGIRLINLDNWRIDLVEMLDEIGFFDLLQIPRPQTSSEKRSDISVVRFQTGSTFGNTEAGSLMKTLATMIVTADHADALDDPTTLAARLRLYSALVEACENARRHAYPAAAAVDPAVRRWWMTGAVHQAEKRLTLVVYDQGVTIPASLPGWLGYSWIERALRLLSLAPLQEGDPSRDGLILRLAMNSPRSSTGLDHRGKGFPAFKQVIKECERGKLRIVSRHGEFIYEKGRRPFGRQLESPLEGTLVEWDLWL